MSYSVAIPAYNAAETIAQSLDSVLAQTVPPAEIVVVDDGSSDNTAEIAAAHSDLITVIRQGNAGSGQACSRAIMQTSQPIVATLDADDLWVPHKMETQLPLLGRDTDRRLICARHRQFHHGSDDYETGEIRDGMTRSDLLMRRATFTLVGDVIDPVGGRGEMIDWFARAREAGCKMHRIDEVLVLRRIIKGSLSYGRDPAKDRGYLEVAYRAMQRRKQNASDGAG